MQNTSQKATNANFQINKRDKHEITKQNATVFVEKDSAKQTPTAWQTITKQSDGCYCTKKRCGQNRPPAKLALPEFCLCKHDIIKTSTAKNSG